MGAWVAGISAGVAVFTAFALRTRVPAAVVVAVLAAAGAGMAWGGMLLRAGPSAVEVALAVAALAVLVPAHVRIVLGPLGPRARRPVAGGQPPPELPRAAR